MQTNIKSSRGFTIVELLIVIVVIAILAAISIIAYNGIQNRGKSSAAQSLASQIAKKADIYQTARTTGSGYPTHGELTAATSAVKEAQLDDPAKVTDAATATPTTEKTVAYKTCTSGGAQVVWWNAAAPSGNSSKLVLIGVGGAPSTAADATAAPTVCA